MVESTPTPAAEDAGPLDELAEAARALVLEHVEADDVRAVFETGSRVDTGAWFRRRRVRVVCLADGSVMLVAAGPRPLVATAEPEAVSESVYNHVTGQVVLAPGGALPVTALKMDPVEGRRLLDQLIGPPEAASDVQQT